MFNPAAAGDCRSCVPCPQLLRTHWIFSIQRRRQEQETVPDGNVSGSTNLAGVVIRSRRVLVAHALLRAVSALLRTPWLFAIQRRRQEQETVPDGSVSGTTNLAGVVIRSRRVLVAHALLRAVSALLPTPWLPGIQRRRQEQQTIPSGTSLAPQTSASGCPLFPTICAQVCGKWRRGTQECVRHLRHLFFPTVCAEVSGKCRRGKLKLAPPPMRRCVCGGH